MYIINKKRKINNTSILKVNLLSKIEEASDESDNQLKSINSESYDPDKENKFQCEPDANNTFDDIINSNNNNNTNNNNNENGNFKDDKNEFIILNDGKDVDVDLLGDDDDDFESYNETANKLDDGVDDETFLNDEKYAEYIPDEKQLQECDEYDDYEEDESFEEDEPFEEDEDYEEYEEDEGDVQDAEDVQHIQDVQYLQDLQNEEDLEYEQDEEDEEDEEQQKTIELAKNKNNKKKQLMK